MLIRRYGVRVMDSEVWWIIVIVLAACAWAYGDRQRRGALLAVERACRDAKVQWLDQALVLKNREWRFKHRSYWPVLTTVYTFEYSSDGQERRSGEVFMVFSQVQWVHVANTFTQETLH
jgi:hypothetical protein